MEGLHADEGSVGGNHSRASSRGRRSKKGSEEGNSRACKKGIILDMILMRGLRKGNEPCLISPSNLIAVNLQKQVKDLEIQLSSRCHRKEHEHSSDGPDYTRGESSRGGSSYRSRDKSHETLGHHHESPIMTGTGIIMPH